MGKRCEAGTERTPVPEQPLARSVFGPLGGVVEIGQALITAALCAEVAERDGAARIAECLGIVCDLVEPSGRHAPGTAFRMWRVAHLPDTFRPDSPAPPWGRVAYRAYDPELGRLLAPA